MSVYDINLKGSRRFARQRGAVLLVALIFLVLLTLLAIGASTSSLLQEHMVAAVRNAQLAQLGGDAALRGAEWRIWSNATNLANGAFQCNSGDINPNTGCIKYDPANAEYAPDGDVTKFLTSSQWLNGIGLSYTGADNSTFTSDANGNMNSTAWLAQNPQYLIEDLGLERPPGAGPQHESGATGFNSNSPGQVRLELYRITARATGGNSNAIRVLQTTFDAQTN